MHHKLLLLITDSKYNICYIYYIITVCPLFLNNIITFKPLYIYVFVVIVLISDFDVDFIAKFNIAKITMCRCIMHDHQVRMKKYVNCKLISTSKK